jgi:pimeloyl-ACP methyl ester carboxylesterase
MRVQIGDVRLFFDVDGTKLRPEGSLMREVPTLLLLHGGPGFDHSGFKPDFAQLADLAQVVYPTIVAVGAATVARSSVGN